jgi:predicted phosphodiesterase
MRYLICSDVHSNLEALEALLLQAEGEKADRFFMLGDVVGYGPDPGPCLRQIRRAADVVLAGNHDHGATSLTDISYFNPLAQAAILWTREQLSEIEIEYLAQLPLLCMVDDFFLSIPPRGTRRGGITY